MRLLEALAATGAALYVGSKHTQTFVKSFTKDGRYGETVEVVNDYKVRVMKEEGRNYYLACEGVDDHTQWTRDRYRVVMSWELLDLAGGLTNQWQPD